MKMTIALCLALAAAALPTGSAVAGPPDRIDICHVDGPAAEPTLKTLPAKPAAKHLESHADDFLAEDGSCEPVQLVKILARATTAHPVTGAPVLVSQLVDANHTGVPDEGDVVQTGQYPIDFVPSALGSFTISDLPVEAVSIASDTTVSVAVTGPSGSTYSYFWEDVPDWERYSEIDSSTSRVQLYDGIGNYINKIHVTTGTPSAADTPTSMTADAGGDDPFIDVVVNPSD
ncbi:MAG TPA: hypothetical protein VJ978_08980 [Nitriliruptoraceae bacterium]|nr:hypothetical protein [Nitriliruptoraceae bacterium]